MTTRKPENDTVPPQPGQDVTVALTGIEIKSETGRLAANSRTRTGPRGRGKYDREVIAGHDYSASGRMVKKDRLIDRVNDLYVEKVADADTGEVLREVEEPLSEHINRGSAKDPRR
jgi:hypothetical protein